ncbi:AraC family transcriptional regulator [Clostridium sp. KLE 1755]
MRKGYRLCEACYAAGFHNYSNFSRTFSLQTGMSPKQYQLSLRN